MSFMDFLFGKGEKTEQFQRFNPQQQDVLNRLLEGGEGQLGDAFGYLQGILGNNPEAFEKFAAPSRRSFEENTIPTIAERFSGLNAQKSSAFPQALGKAAAGLEENLSAQRAGLQQNALSQLTSLLGTGLTPQFENVFRPGTEGFLGGLGNQIGSGLGQAGGALGLSKLLPLLGLI